MNELKHYGVLGMKWGRRKGSTARGGSSTKASRKSEKEANKYFKKNQRSIMQDGANKIGGGKSHPSLKKIYNKYSKALDKNGWDPSSKEYSSYATEYGREMVRLLNTEIKANAKSSYTTKQGEKWSSQAIETMGGIKLTWQKSN